MHYSVAVIAEQPADVAHLMEPHREWWNEETDESGGWWDYWSFGARWSGELRVSDRGGTRAESPTEPACGLLVVAQEALRAAHRTSPPMLALPTWEWRDDSAPRVGGSQDLLVKHARPGWPGRKRGACDAAPLALIDWDAVGMAQLESLREQHHDILASTWITPERKAAAEAVTADQWAAERLGPFSTYHLVTPAGHHAKSHWTGDEYVDDDNYLDTFRQAISEGTRDGLWLCILDCHS